MCFIQQECEAFIAGGEGIPTNDSGIKKIQTFGDMGRMVWVERDGCLFSVAGIKVG